MQVYVISQDSTMIIMMIVLTMLFFPDDDNDSGILWIYDDDYSQWNER